MKIALWGPVRLHDALWHVCDAFRSQRPLVCLKWRSNRRFLVANAMQDEDKDRARCS